MNVGSRLKPIKSLDEIPENMTEEEAAEFYGTHSLGLVLDQTEPVYPDEFQVASPAPMKRLSLTLREDVLERLKKIAKANGVPLHTLVRSCLKERLEQEEAKSTQKS